MQEDINLRFKGFRFAKILERSINTVHIIGLGGLGSWFVVPLLRAGFDVILHDEDKVELHNIGGQMYRLKDVGNLKSLAMTNIAYEFTGRYPRVIRRHIKDLTENRSELTTNGNTIIIAATDNFESRLYAFQKYMNKLRKTDNKVAFIDVRMNGVNSVIYTIPYFRLTKHTKKELSTQIFADYISTLHFGYNETGTCTTRQTTHFAQMTGGLVVTIATRIIEAMEDSDKTSPFADAPNLEEYGISFRHMMIFGSLDLIKTSYEEYIKEELKEVSRLRAIFIGKNEVRGNLRNFIRLFSEDSVKFVKNYLDELQETRDNS